MDRIEGYRWGFDEAVLRYVIELVSVFGAAAFIGGVALNSMVFSAWGLTFLQLASPGDVIMSGFQIFWWLVPYLIATVGGIAAAFSVPQRFARRAAIVGAATTVIAVVIGSTVSTSTAFQEWVLVPSALMAFVFTLLMFLRSMVGKADWSRRSGTFTASLLILAVLIFAIPVHYRFEQKAAEGFHDEAMTVRDESCPIPARVLWIGDRAIVAACGSDRPVALLHTGQRISPVADARGG